MRLILRGADGSCSESNSAPQSPLRWVCSRSRWCSSGLQFIFQHITPPFLTHFLSLSHRLFFPFLAQSLATKQMSVDVEKYHKLICQSCNPVIPLNVTNEPWRLWRRRSSKKGKYGTFLVLLQNVHEVSFIDNEWKWILKMFVLFSVSSMIISDKSSIWGAVIWVINVLFTVTDCEMCQLHKKRV